VSEVIEELAALEQRLLREEINLLLAMARQPAEGQFAGAELSRVADIHAALEAVRTELSARLPREGYSAPTSPALVAGG
jgi:hypothetical protein